MHAEELGALSRRRNGSRLRPRFAGCRQLAARNPLDEALARGTDQKRHAEPMEQARMGDQGQVMSERLAEAETRICGNARAGNARGLQSLDAVLQVIIDLEHDVRVSRIV